MSIPQPPARAWFYDGNLSQWELRDEDHGTSMVPHRYAVVTDEDLASADADFLANVARVTGAPFPDAGERAAMIAAIEAADVPAGLANSGPAAIEAG